MVHVFSAQGTKTKELNLPSIFNTPYHPTLIARAVLAVQSTRLQPHGTKRGSGRNNTAEYVGVRGKPTQYRTINVGHARLPRMRNRRGVLQGKVASVPQAVGGPEAHPPKVEKRLEERINIKERKLAIASAIAATISAKLVKARGHHFDAQMYPLVVDNTFEKIGRTKDAMKALEALKVSADVDYAKDRKRIRAGKHKNRGNPYKQKKSLLIVTNHNQPVTKATRNIPGVDVVSVQRLNAEHLAPGTHAGRLTIWTEEAIKVLAERGNQ